MKKMEPKFEETKRLKFWVGSLRWAGLDANPSERVKWVLMIFLQVVCVGLLFLLAKNSGHTQPSYLDEAQWRYMGLAFSNNMHVMIDCTHEDSKGVVWHTY